MPSYCPYCQVGLLCDRHFAQAQHRETERKARLAHEDAVRSMHAKRAAARYKRENEGVAVPPLPEEKELAGVQ